MKAKGLKRKSTMVMSNPTSHKSIEEKKRPGNSGDVHQSWGKALIEQNKVDTEYMILRYFFEIFSKLAIGSLLLFYLGKNAVKPSMWNSLHNICF